MPGGLRLTVPLLPTVRLSILIREGMLPVVRRRPDHLQGPPIERARAVLTSSAPRRAGAVGCRRYERVRE